MYSRCVGPTFEWWWVVGGGDKGEGPNCFAPCGAVKC